jgi:hypothetical protein
MFQNNFGVWWNPRDKFYTNQRIYKRIGDVDNGEEGDVSDDYKEHAFKQYQEHDFNKLKEMQDDMTKKLDPIYGSPERENNRNYSRMEYDFPERNDGKGHTEVMDEVNAKVEMNVKKLQDVIKSKGYTQNTTASAFGTDPIVKKDYEDQLTK